MVCKVLKMNVHVGSEDVVVATATILRWRVAWRVVKMIVHVSREIVDLETSIRGTHKDQCFAH